MVLWCAGMGDGNEGARLAERVVYWGLLLSVGRGRGSSVVMARKSWGKGGGRRRVVGVARGEGEAEVGEEGWRLPLSWPRLGDFDLRFFLADVLEMDWVVSCAVRELKGWRERPDFRSPAKNLCPRLYPKFHLTSNSH